jgi:protein-disulfide isomerase
VTALSKSKSSAKRTRIIVGAVVVIAVAVIALVAVIANQTTLNTSTTDYAQMTKARQADGGFVLGDPDAPITIVAFEDFLCSHCQRYKSTVDQLISEYVATGRARFEYRFTPVVHPSYSKLAAQLTECAEDLRPGSFWQAHDVMFEIASARQYSDNSSRTFAEQMELSYTDLLECTSDASQYVSDMQLADQLGVTGTPTVFIRYNNGFPQASPVGRQPTFAQLRMLVEGAG